VGERGVGGRRRSVSSSEAAASGVFGGGDARERGVGPSTLARTWVLDKLGELKQRRKSQERQREFARRAARSAQEAGGPEPTEEEIVETVRATREEIYRERES